MSQILVPVAFGELIDKITILQIKAERITDSAKLANVERELQVLLQAWRSHAAAATGIDDLQARLKAVNEALWDVEDRIRLKEAAGEFDAEFVELARSVYLRNDERAAHKRAIDERLGSDLLEEKSYADYRRVAG